MLLFKTAPSMYTPCRFIWWNSSDCTLTFTLTAVSRSCVPFKAMSGSTIGTRPWDWQISAYRAKSRMLVSIVKSDGWPFATSISSGDRHLPCVKQSVSPESRDGRFIQ